MKVTLSITKTEHDLVELEGDNATELLLQIRELKQSWEQDLINEEYLNIRVYDENYLDVTGEYQP